VTPSTDRLPKTLIIALTLAVVALPSIADSVLFTADFEQGDVAIDTIRRFSDEPRIIFAPPPGLAEAHPPPSGRGMLAVSPDPANDGLGAALLGPVVDRRDPSHPALTLEARIYVLPSSDANEHDFAVLAIDDSGSVTPVERYHRFGFRSGVVYHQVFNGAEFSAAVGDASLGSQLQVPGWHLFSMRFEGPEQIRFFVDGQETAFSPLMDDAFPRVRLGIMAWNQADDHPLLVDDVDVLAADAAATPQEIIVEASGTDPRQGAFHLIQGPWLASVGKSRAPGLTDGSATQFIEGGRAGSAVFVPNVPVTARYHIFTTWPSSGNASEVLYTVNHADGSTQTTLNQDGWGALAQPDANRWHSLGVHRLRAGSGNSVTISAQANSRALDPRNSHRVYADAIRIVPADVDGPIIAAMSPPQAAPAPTPPPATVDGEIGWRSSLYVAEIESRASQRPIIAFLFVPQNETCREMLETTLSAPNVVDAVNRSAVPVRVNLNEHPELQVRFSVYRLPTLVKISPGGSVEDRLVHRFSGEEVLGLLP